MVMSAPEATGTGADPPDARHLLERGVVTLEGRLPWSSNGTFLVSCTDGDDSTRAVYKPVRGERPLWDFPPGLHKREVAAYVLSEALGWELVPPTVMRADAPVGEGSLQLFVDADFEQHYFTLYEVEHHHETLRRVCLFDLLINSTDRKSGHLLIDGDAHVWAIDNGLSFSADFKLRTVIWEFGGEPVPAPLLADVERLVATRRESGLDAELRQLLDRDERVALFERAASILARPCFPVDATGRRYPWPLV
jgi:uncharacterized repeat protein (TIGR03843 family)